MPGKVCALILTAAASHVLMAQPAAANSQPRVYITSTSYHVSDDSRAAYESWMKDRFKRFAEGMLKEDPALASIIATRVVFGGVMEPEANAYIAWVRSSLPTRSLDMQNKVSKQLFDKSYDDFLAEARPLRKRLGSTLSTRIASAPGVIEEGDVVRFDFKRVTAGRMQEYVKMERDYEPFRAAQVKAGSMKAWSMAAVMLPGGTEREFDAYTVHVGKDLDQVMNWNRNAQAIAAGMQPPFDVAAVGAHATEVQKIVRGEARVVTMIVNRPMENR
jgi:hypothetical protein